MGNKKIGLILCGCGHRDGTEIQEATLALLAIDRAGGEAICFAPQGHQTQVFNHLLAQEVPEKRDMLIESARISRGNIRDIREARASKLDALIIPGGRGAASNLSTFLSEGTSCLIHPEFERIVKDMYELKKPIGAICIIPALLARIFQRMGIKVVLTAGNPSEVASQIVEMGQINQDCSPTDCICDRTHRVVSTPAYMNGKTIGEIWLGIEKMTNFIFALSNPQ